MTISDFTTAILVGQTPKEGFNAINNVRGWWSEEIEGGTDQLNDVWNYRYKDIHLCKIKIVESIPDKKVVCLLWTIILISLKATSKNYLFFSGRHFFCFFRLPLW